MSASLTSLPDGAEEFSVAGFNQYVGPLFRVPEADAQRGRFVFVASEKYMNSGGGVHGGMLVTFMDVAMSQTAGRASGARSLSTVSLNCDFVAPGRLGETIEGHARVVRRARSLVFLSGELRAADRVLLVATGLWKIVDA